MRFGTIADGRHAGELRVPSQVSNFVRGMDGERFFAFLVHPAPDHYDIYVDGPWEHADQYLQCAGSASRLVIEVRRREGDAYRQYALGRPGEQASETIVSVKRAEHTTEAYEHEVFDADQAVVVFEHYVANSAAVPPGVRLRELNVG